METDVGENHNLAKSMPEKANELQEPRLVKWRQEVNAPMPTKNKGATSQPPKAKKGQRQKESR